MLLVQLYTKAIFPVVRICLCDLSIIYVPSIKLAILENAGFNVETVEYKNISFTVWDVGGQDKVRICLKPFVFWLWHFSYHAVWYFLVLYDNMKFITSIMQNYTWLQCNALS
jgi:GTPase SAR1 family protein